MLNVCFERSYIMKKRFILASLIFVFMVVALSLTVSATSQSVFNGVDVNSIENTNVNVFQDSLSSGEVILTRHSNGVVTSSVHTPSLLNDIDISLGAYFPDSENSSDISLASMSTDPYGREVTADRRIGQIICGFNIDDDVEVEVYASGTASLQSYDLLVSCAHCVWNPRYVSSTDDGWASTLTYYACRTGENTYAAVADSVNISISQNFINNSAYYQDTGVTVYAYDWDWSIIQIDKFLGDDLGWLGLENSGTDQEGDVIYTIGYPADKDFGTQWSSWGVITGYNTGNVVHYSAYIQPGNSGGPLLDTDGNVCGIATFYAYENDPSWWLYSGGTRMYDSLYSLILTEKSASTERWFAQQ